MKMKQFFQLTFLFLLLVCLAHTAGEIKDQGKRLHPRPGGMEGGHIALAYTR